MFSKGDRIGEQQGDVLPALTTQQQSVLVALCASVLAAFTLVLALLTLSICCCHKHKSDSSGHDEEQEEEKQDDSEAGSSINSANRKHSQPRPSQAHNNNGTQKSSEDVVISVRDRIHAFETAGDSTAKKAGSAGPVPRNKPRKKKPNSKAFEDFESTGILIGFGNVPRHHKKQEEEGQSGVEEEDLNNEELQSGVTSATKKSFEEDEGIHTMDSEDDDFAAVQRNSKILKSFRRAPPPRRTHGKRSGHHSQDKRRSGTATDGSEDLQQSHDSGLEKCEAARTACTIAASGGTDVSHSETVTVEVATATHCHQVFQPGKPIQSECDLLKTQESTEVNISSGTDVNYTRSDTAL